MEFLKSVRVTDFRSIARAEISGLTEITPIVGLNGSGKSNLLRALNLFFNNYIEEATSLDLRRDFREPGRRVKLLVQVEVDLDYEVFGPLRRELTDAFAQLATGSPQITIRKEWALDSVTGEPAVTIHTGPTGSTLGATAPEDTALVTRLLNVVRFRYIPNHVHPSRILANEESEIRRMLFDRLGKQQVLQANVVAEIARVSSDLMQPIVDVMSEATGDVAGVELAAPTDWRDLVWTFGMRMRSAQSQAFDALLHGSGVQSVLAYAVLHAVDTSFSGSFGWRKGTLWALEEPESFLHAGLQEELARMLASYVAGDRPVQMFLTSHATPFLGVAETGVLATLDPAGRTELRCVARAELLRTAFTTRVSPFAHALHSGPPKPMLLVEGKSDRDLIVRAYSDGDVPNPFDVRALEDLQPGLQGGDDVARWLKYNAPALSARPETSPIFVLRDWESAQKVVNAINAALACHATSRCIVWPVDLTNPDLSPRFVGIEKFLSTDFMTDMTTEIQLQLTTPVDAGAATWRYEVLRAALDDKKSALHTALARRGDPADIEPLIHALTWLSGNLVNTPALL